MLKNLNLKTIFFYVSLLIFCILSQWIFNVDEFYKYMLCVTVFAILIVGFDYIHLYNTQIIFIYVILNMLFILYTFNVDFYSITFYLQIVSYILYIKFDNLVRNM
jgi:hypothetical protein